VTDALCPASCAANGHAEQPAETEQERRKREKREKREARRKKQQPEEAAAAPQEQQQAAAEAAGKQQDDEPAQEQQQEQQQGEQPDEKTSGKANAEEAAKIRSVLGFQGTAAKPGQFGFGFSVSVEERVEAETKAKLDRLIAQDATPDGCVPRKVRRASWAWAWADPAGAGIAMLACAKSPCTAAAPARMLHHPVPCTTTISDLCSCAITMRHQAT
jgi:hypothetical protein